MTTTGADDATEVTGGAVVAPQPHGGALRPWQPGQSGNPSGRPNAVREALRLAREASPEAMRLLIEMMNDPAEDSRVRAVAATHILDRALGKPKDEAQPEPVPTRVDVSHLTAEQRQALAAAIGTVRQLAGIGRDDGGAGY